jgi:hypothetical protein
VCACAGPIRFKRSRTREVMTAIGAVPLERSHGYCKDCRQPQFAADRLLGLDGWLTPRARSMADRAGLQDAFRPAQALLSALAGWSLGAETIRRYCHEDAARARAGRGERRALPERFAAAAGDRELHIDAGKVNPREGYRDVKVAVAACRERAAPATAEGYEQRDLPGPSLRSVVAEVEEASAFGGRCAAEAARLGLSADGLSVLGDGAEWIWKLAALHFAGAAQLLDVFHGCEHLATAGRAALGEGPDLKRWLEEARGKLIGDGYWGVAEAIAGLGVDPSAAARLGSAAGQVLNYFAGHQGRLGYAPRLRRGQAIGSGLVEGTIKQLVNVRMKNGGARWLPERVGPFVELMAMADGPEWSEFWMDMAA